MTASPAAIPNSPSWPGGAAVWSRTACSGSISLTLRSLFLLQFIFDTTTPSTCLREPSSRQYSSGPRPRCTENCRKGASQLGGIDVAAAENKKALKDFIEFPYALYRDD